MIIRGCFFFIYLDIEMILSFPSHTAFWMYLIIVAPALAYRL